MKSFVLSTLGLILILSIINCTGNQPRWNEQVNTVLQSAGDNRSELEAVLAHYDTLGDSLKFAAALHLIGNMAEHSYVTYYMHDTTGNELPFSVQDYPDYATLTKSADSLENEVGLIDFTRNDPIYDMNVISAEFLKTQIDYAFRAWRERPWAQGLSWEDFRDYVLPYRGSNEPLEEWRATLFDKYNDIPAQLEDPSDPMAAAVSINNDIMTWFGFDPRYYYHPTDQGLSEMMNSGLGRCEDMTNVTIYAMRANGIGVTSDYTPHWANTGNNHAWNAIVTPSGEVIPFMGAEASPGEYRLANRFAKIYRKTFDEQADNLVFQDNKQEKIPRWLGGKYYRDVTTEYTDPCTFSLELLEVPDSVNVAYLCVFNSGEWRAIDWGWIKDGTAEFEDLGDSIAYLPAYYLNEEIVPAGHPFILADCEVQPLIFNPFQARTVSLVATTKRSQVASTDGIAHSFLKEGQNYELFFYAGDWESLGQAEAGDAPLSFEEVPFGALYWLVATDGDREERIFTIEDGVQIWW